MSEKTGTYKYDKTSGKVIKVSERIPVIKKIAPWKREMNPEEESRRGYAEMEAKGTLKEVDDKEVWGDYVRR